MKGVKGWKKKKKITLCGRHIRVLQHPAKVSDHDWHHVWHLWEPNIIDGSHKLLYSKCPTSEHSDFSAFSFGSVAI